MAHLSQHEDDCRRFLGDPWTKVHEWLDGLFQTCGPSHRFHRHHVEGVEEVRRMWGDDAALAAKIHIIIDCWGIPSKAEWESGLVNALGCDDNATQTEALAMLRAVLDSEDKGWDRYGEK